MKMNESDKRSAHGLFAAMGHVSKEKPVRRKDDIYATPPEATKALVLAEERALSRFPVVWEPAVGDGAVARVLKAHGYDVVASDLVDRGYGAKIRDFYEFDSPPSKAIITNPPYCEANWGIGKARWMRHAFGIGVEYMALLLNLNWLGAAGLKPLLDCHPISRVYVLRWRLDFTGLGSPPQTSAWVIWDSRHKYKTHLEFLDKPE